MDQPAYVIEVDALYFQARETGVAYAIKNQRVKHPEFHPHFGVRAKGAFALCSQFSLWAQYLHYHARARNEGKGIAFTPTWSHSFQDSSLDSYENMWRLHLGLFDLGLSHPWQVGKCVKLSLLIALRYAEIRHKLKVNYGMLETLSMKNKFWSGGPLMGVEGHWMIGSYMTFFGRGAMSLVFGTIYVHQDDSMAGTNLKFFDDFNQVRGIGEGALGIEFPFLFSTRIRLAWEAYLFWHQNQFVSFSDPSMPGKGVLSNGDLSLQGLSIGLIF